MKKDKLLLIIVLFVSILGIFYFANNKEEIAPQPTPQAEIQTDSMVVDYSGKVDVYSYKYADNLTVFNVLEEYTKENDIELTSKQYDFGVFVEGIGDYKNTNEMVWIYYVNNESANVSADNYPLSSEDKIKWAYQKPIY